MSRRKTTHGSITRRGDAYRVRLLVSGRNYSATLHGVTRKQAQDHLDEKYVAMSRLAEAGDGSHPILRVSDLCREWARWRISETVRDSTRRAYLQDADCLLRYWRDVAGDPQLVKLAKRDVRKFIDWRKGHRFTRSGKVKVAATEARTVQKDRTLLSMIFAWGVDEGQIGKNPAAGRVRNLPHLHRSR